MEEALTYAAAAPFIVVVVALIRALVQDDEGESMIKGRYVPPIVLVLTVAWGGLLVSTGRYTGDPAEFVVATVVVASTAMGLAGFASAVTGKSSTVHRFT